MSFSIPSLGDDDSQPPSVNNVKCPPGQVNDITGACTTCPPGFSPNLAGNACQALKTVTAKQVAIRSPSGVLIGATAPSVVGYSPSPSSYSTACPPGSFLASNGTCQTTATPAPAKKISTVEIVLIGGGVVALATAAYFLLRK
jgi:hypothetical protein